MSDTVFMKRKEDVLLAISRRLEVTQKLINLI